jgi:hypothetical protein
MGKADEQTKKRFEQAMKRLGENPIAIILAEGDADPGQLFEVADALVAITCIESKALQDRALTKAAKVVRKEWGRFLGDFRMLAMESKKVIDAKEAAEE